MREMKPLYLIVNVEEIRMGKFSERSANGNLECLLCIPRTLVSKDKDGCISSRLRHLKRFLH